MTHQWIRKSWGDLAVVLVPEEGPATMGGHPPGNWRAMRVSRRAVLTTIVALSTLDWSEWQGGAAPVHDRGMKGAIHEASGILGEEVTTNRSGAFLLGPDAVWSRLQEAASLQNECEKLPCGRVRNVQQKLRKTLWLNTCSVRNTQRVLDHTYSGGVFSNATLLAEEPPKPELSAPCTNHGSREHNEAGTVVRLVVSGWNSKWLQNTSPTT